ncbi:hypothetical protein GCM10011579_068260 [Streptomyces albiflavescens]|uniref:Uncharacterized protein n=1 Tax=Streptomyces albiflavescens TaxID=1623582 RepID=A0A917YAR6_9ACTN|nr:hypothetical protein GCM10011579_068260 [Streptomyces albiflavescens]
MNKSLGLPNGRPSITAPSMATTVPAAIHHRDSWDSSVFTASPPAAGSMGSAPERSHCTAQPTSTTARAPRASLSVIIARDVWVATVPGFFPMT